MADKLAKGVTMAGEKTLEHRIESRGICGICRRFMTNQQELTEVDGKKVHRACLPGSAEIKKRSNSYE